jgi:DnaJ-domain-containing protein 1
MRTRTEAEKEAEEWKRIEERRRAIYEELWRADEERVRKQRQRDPQANRRREGHNHRTRFSVNVKEILRATQDLGVRIGATVAEVKAAYKKKAMAWHPDRPGGSAEKMKDINEAKEVLLKSS